WRGDLVAGRRGRIPAEHQPAPALPEHDLARTRAVGGVRGVGPDAEPDGGRVAGALPGGDLVEQAIGEGPLGAETAHEQVAVATRQQHEAAGADEADRAAELARAGKLAEAGDDLPLGCPVDGGQGAEAGLAQGDPEAQPT